LQSSRYLQFTSVSVDRHLISRLSPQSAACDAVQSQLASTLASSTALIIIIIITKINVIINLDRRKVVTYRGAIEL